MNTTFATILEIVGTLAFAISGIRLAAAKQFDWFGAYAVGLVTAIGGGTLRDVLLNATPFWMINGSYLTVTAIALIFVIIFKQYLVKLENTFFIFDTIGLALFVVVGAIVMGTITGAVGSIIRDILINEEPLLFRKDIYALACVAGGIMFYLGEKMGFNSITNQSICGISVVAVRLLAVKFHWSLPALKDDTTNPI